jgi:hypothetical protein
MFTWHVQKVAASSTHSDRTGKALDPKVTSNFIFLEKSTAFGFENYEIYNNFLFYLGGQQTTRRLAQNREAARKSRLRKKVDHVCFVIHCIYDICVCGLN